MYMTRFDASASQRLHFIHGLLGRQSFYLKLRNIHPRSACLAILLARRWSPVEFVRITDLTASSGISGRHIGFRNRLAFRAPCKGILRSSRSFGHVNSDTRRTFSVSWDAMQVNTILDTLVHCKQ